MSAAIKACENTFTQNLQVIARFGRDIGQRKTRIVHRKSRIVDILLVQTRINLEAKAVERVRKFWERKRCPHAQLVNTANGIQDTGLGGK